MSKQMMLNRIRQKLNVQSGDRTRIQTVNTRLTEHQANTIPQRGRKPQAELIDDFEQRISAAHATVKRVGSMSDVPKAVADFLGESDLCLNPEIRSQLFDFDAVPELRLVSWTAKTSMEACLSGCFGAVAESGSLVILSSQDNAISQNFLAEKHIVLLDANNIVGAYEDIWTQLRNTANQDEAAGGYMPRDLTLVSGPSCTGDIEMIMEYGAHGPRQLHVIMVMENKRMADGK